MNQIEHWDYTIKEWSQGEFALMLDEAFSQNPKVVYDVGACVGGWSQAIRRYEPEQTYAFEPFPANFAQLQENNIPGVEILNLGIWYGKKTARAKWRGSNVGAIFIDEVDTTDCMETGEVFNLTIFEELSLPRPDLIKLDVEGAEKNIIENSTILRTVPQLIIEWHFTGFEDGADYFKKHLPHTIVRNIHNGMYLLRL